MHNSDFCPVFLNASERVTFFHMKLVILWQRCNLTAWSKTKGRCGSCPVNPTQEKLSSSRITPCRSLTSLSLAGENTQTGVFFPVLKEVMQKYLFLRCINFSSLQCVDRDASISTVSGTENSAILDEQSSFIKERKGIPALGI